MTRRLHFPTPETTMHLRIELEDIADTLADQALAAADEFHRLEAETAAAFDRFRTLDMQRAAAEQALRDLPDELPAAQAA